MHNLRVQFYVVEIVSKLTTFPSSSTSLSSIIIRIIGSILFIASCSPFYQGSENFSFEINPFCELIKSLQYKSKVSLKTNRVKLWELVTCKVKMQW